MGMCLQALLWTQQWSTYLSSTSIFAATMVHLGQANPRTIMSYTMSTGLVLTRSRSLPITCVSPLLGVQNPSRWSPQCTMLTSLPIEEGCTMMQLWRRLELQLQLHHQLPHHHRRLELGLMRGFTVRMVLWRT